ncbi:MAG TPA: hypothetical protein VF532_10690 [Candidatus Angelobacter sp.]
MKPAIWIGVACMLVLTSAAVYSHSQAQPAQDYQAIADRFFNLLQEGKSGEAIDYLFATNPELKKMTDKADNVKAKFAEAEKLLGPYAFHAKLMESKVAGAYVYQHYFVAYERQPMSVRLKFYKPHNTWMAHGIQFDLDLTDAIQKQTDENLSREFK